MNIYSHMRNISHLPFPMRKADRLDEPVRFSKKGVRKDQIQPSISRAA